MSFPWGEGEAIRVHTRPKKMGLPRNDVGFYLQENFGLCENQRFNFTYFHHFMKFLGKHNTNKCILLPENERTMNVH